jgi:hypothetical protein
MPAVATTSCTTSAVPKGLPPLLTLLCTTSCAAVAACSGYHILYHECCAVYSCGAEDTPITGMADAEVMRWYKHGEKASGIGLKCQLCGKR